MVNFIAVIIASIAINFLPVPLNLFMGTLLFVVAISGMLPIRKKTSDG